MSTTATPTIAIRRLSTFHPAPIDWLWEPYIPRGQLTLLLGTTSGKTALALDLAARVSCFSPMPPLPPAVNPPRQVEFPAGDGGPPIFFDAPADTLLVSPIHGAARTLCPRLERLAPHASLDSIHLLWELPGFHTRDHLDILTSAIENLPKLAFLIIDPLPHGANHPSPEFFFGLAQLADRLNFAVLLTAPLLTSIHGTAPHNLCRLLQRIPIARIPGTIHLLLPPPNPDAPPGDRYLLPIKSPTPALPPPLRFSLTQSLQWHPTPVTATEVLTSSDSILDHVKDFLSQLLANGPLSAESVKYAAEVNSIPRVTLFRAKAALNVQSRRKGYQTPWYWFLPGDTRPIPDRSLPSAGVSNPADLLKLLSTIGSR